METTSYNKKNKKKTADIIAFVTLVFILCFIILLSSVSIAPNVMLPILLLSTAFSEGNAEKYCNAEKFKR